MRGAAVCVVMIVPMLAGCSIWNPNVDVTGDWVLQSGSLDGQPIPLVEAHPATLTIRDGRVSGTASCNQYGGPITISGSTVTLGDIMQTLVACLDADQMASEQAFMRAFRRVTSVRRDSSALVLSGDGIELRFGPADLPALLMPDQRGTMYPAQAMTASIGRHPQDAWLALISNRNG